MNTVEVNYKDFHSTSQVLATVTAAEAKPSSNSGYKKPKNYKPKKHYGPQIKTQINRDHEFSFDKTPVYPPLPLGLLGGLTADNLVKIWRHNVYTLREYGIEIFEEITDHGITCKCCSKKTQRQREDEARSFVRGFKEGTN
jgi:hypothetical protein